MKDFSNTYMEIAKAIKGLDIDKFQVLTTGILINFNQCIDGCASNCPKTLLDYLSVMLKAKNRDPFLQSLFVSRLWEMYSSSKMQANLINEVGLSLLPLMFLRERNEDNLKKQIKLFFKLLDSEPHDIFLSKLSSLVNLFQNPFFNNAQEVINHLKKRKNGFDFIGYFKVKEQCYYQKDMLLSLLNYIKENKVTVSYEALYKACNNLSINAVNACHGDVEVNWLSYSPKEIQKTIEDLIMDKLGLIEKHREYIPLIVASKYFKDCLINGDVLFNHYSNFLNNYVMSFYVNLKNWQEFDDFFKTLKHINVPSDFFSVLETKYLIDKETALFVIDDTQEDELESEDFKI